MRRVFRHNKYVNEALFHFFEGTVLSLWILNSKRRETE